MAFSITYSELHNAITIQQECEIIPNERGDPTFNVKSTE